jgi:hypothetical protein
MFYQYYIPDGTGRTRRNVREAILVEKNKNGKISCPVRDKISVEKRVYELPEVP